MEISHTEKHRIDYTSKKIKKINRPTGPVGQYKMFYIYVMRILEEEEKCGIEKYLKK